MATGWLPTVSKLFKFSKMAVVWGLETLGTAGWWYGVKTDFRYRLSVLLPFFILLHRRNYSLAEVLCQNPSPHDKRIESGYNGNTSLSTAGGRRQTGFWEPAAAMLDFRSKTKSQKNPYGPEVSRWVWMLFFLGLVVILAGPLTQPATWQFIARGFRWAGTERPIDTRLESKAKEDTSGAVLFLPVEEVSASRGIVPVGFRQEPILARQELEQIQDDSPFRRPERELWRRLLQVLHDTAEADLQKHSEGLVSYGQLFRQSGAYRGRLVTLRGQLRRAERVPMPSNPWGQQEYYQTWLQPVDQPANPIQIYCLELPEGFPLGLQIQEEVEVTGFYFKRAAYQAQDGLRTAPTLVAKTVRWFPRPTLAPEPAPLTGTPLMLLLAGVAGLGIITAVLLYYRGWSRGRFEVPKVVDFSRWTPPEEGEPSTAVAVASASNGPEADRSSSSGPTDQTPSAPPADRKQAF